MHSVVPPSARPRGLAPSSLLVVLTLAVLFTLALGSSQRLHRDDHAANADAIAIATRQTPAANASLLVDFEVDPPVFTPPADAACELTLMVHQFAFSFGEPFIGFYEPPPCEFNSVTMNFTVTSAGRQFDRLALMYLNDTEVFRTSTAEPTATGITWTYVKDMSNFVTLFKQPQKIIFDLGNLITDMFTAPYNTTLTATFFNVPDAVPAADLIVPISARQSATNGTSVFMFPDVNATNTISLPQNIEKAVFSIAACGQIGEEFWWGNVLSSQTATYPGVTLPGFSPWRELQLYIDGMLAGVAWPFPVIFTGGVVPGFWRPIVGIDAFDLKEDEIDITPFLPLLCDGNEHTFEIRVAGIDDDGNDHGTVISTSGEYWLVTGKIFIWSDSVGSVTTGTTPVRVIPDPDITLVSSIGTFPNGTNETISLDVQVSRQLAISSTVTTSKGASKASWSQSLSFSNKGLVTDQGNTEFNDQVTSGSVHSSLGYSRTFNYPLVVNQSMITKASSIEITGVMDRGKQQTIFGQLSFTSGLKSAELVTGSQEPFTGSDLSTRQNGTATYTSQIGAPTATSWGSTEQVLDFAGLKGSSSGVQGSTQLYHRHVLAVNLTIEEDEIITGGKSVVHSHPHVAFSSHSDFAPLTLQDIKGNDPSTA